MPSLATRSLIFGFAAPARAMPDKSPFTSAMNTGTPIRLKPSAITRSVTVLPVPVAPAISPWRFAIRGSSTRSFLPLAIVRSSDMEITS